MGLKYNYIIPPWDPRYGKIGHLWKKYDWNNLLDNQGYYSQYYYIPPELVLTEYIRSTSVKKSPTSDYDNWVYKRDLQRLLNLCTGLDIQSYFDLLVLKINNIANRPRCPICGTPIYFYSVYYGYGSPYIDWPNKRTLCCSHSCSDILRWRDANDWFNSDEAWMMFSENASNLWESGKWNHDICCDFSELWEIPEFRDKRLKALSDPEFLNSSVPRRAYGQFLSFGELTDICYLYVGICNDLIKFGVTSNPESREYLLGVEGYQLIDFTIPYTGTRLQVANLEAKIKLHYNTRFETLNSNQLTELIELIAKLSLEVDESPYPELIP